MANIKNTFTAPFAKTVPELRRATEQSLSGLVKQLNEADFGGGTTVTLDIPSRVLTVSGEMITIPSAVAAGLDQDQVDARINTLALTALPTALNDYPAGLARDSELPSVPAGTHATNWTDYALTTAIPAAVTAAQVQTNLTAGEILGVYLVEPETNGEPVAADFTGNATIIIQF